jgi:hypothetical protein
MEMIQLVQDSDQRWLPVTTVDLISNHTDARKF